MTGLILVGHGMIERHKIYCRTEERAWIAAMLLGANRAQRRFIVGGRAWVRMLAARLGRMP
jgi:hypothetical protein